MRNLLLLPLFAVILLLPSACRKPATGTFIDSQGHKIAMADWHHKWVVINYWASWCGPCAEEIPQLNLFYQQNNANVVVIGVNYDQPALSDLQMAIKKLNIHFPVLQQNPAQALALPEITVVPTTFIINPQGQLAEPLYGPHTAAQLNDIIASKS